MRIAGLEEMVKVESKERSSERIHMSGRAGRYVWTTRLFGGAEHGPKRQ
jgi:hypothetical protein